MLLSIWSLDGSVFGLCLTPAPEREKVYDGGGGGGGGGGIESVA